MHLSQETVGWLMIGWPIAPLIALAIYSMFREAWTYEGWRGVGGLLLFFVAVGSIFRGLWLVMHGHALGR